MAKCKLKTFMLYRKALGSMFYKMLYTTAPDIMTNRLVAVIVKHVYNTKYSYKYTK